MAALAAGVASSMAQSNVYSLNVVGYVNVPMLNGGFYMLNNPLDAATNDINTIIPGAPDGTFVYFWNTNTQDLGLIVNSTGGLWSPQDAQIAPGQGFFISPGGNYTNTFVGQVRQYPVTNTALGGSAFNAIGAGVPVTGDTTNILYGYPAQSGDIMYPWNPALPDLGQSLNWTGTSWAGGSHSFFAAEGFFLLPAGANVTWVTQFTVH